MIPLLFLLWQPIPPQPAECRDAAALFSRGDLAAALPALQKAAAAHPASPFCAKALGVIHAALGDYRASEAPFARACRLNPAEPDACYYWARTLYSLDQFEASLTALAQAAPSATKPWRIGTARGQALDALGQPGAEAALRHAMTERARDPLPPNEPDPLLSLAAFLYREGRAPEALTLLQAAPAAYQRLAVFHYQVGRARAQAGQWQSAAAALARAVELKDDYPEAHGLLSRCYHQLGQTALAEEHTRKARAKR